MKRKERITSVQVPESTRLYSQAIKANGFLFLSGQGPMNSSGALVGKGDVVAQTRQVFENIKGLTEAAGATMEDVVKLTMYLTDVSNVAAVRPLRAEFFQAPDYPAMSVVGNVGLAGADWLVEIEATVAL